MSNDLNTILDDSSNRALVEKYLETKLLERKDYETVLANNEYAQEFRLPEGSGQYVEATRKGRFRRPQNLDNASPQSDPASGASMAVEKVKFPVEFIQEYLPVGTVAAITSWMDLEAWANEDLPVALKRRMHELTQNSFVVGRFRPGKWAADGTESVAFDAAAEATVTIYGVSFTFKSAPKYYAGLKPAFGVMNENDRASFADLDVIRVRLARAGAPKVNGVYPCFVSDAMAMDLAKDDKYFAAIVSAFKGEGLKTGTLAENYKGFKFIIDDEPYSENWGAENVRASAGAVHTAIICGKGAHAYLNLGGRRTPRPKFKVQDLSKTGVEKTIGYLVPFQSAIVNDDWCAVYKAPVSVTEANNA